MIHSSTFEITEDCNTINWVDNTIYDGVNYPLFSDLVITHKVYRKSFPSNKELDFVVVGPKELNIDYLEDGIIIVEKEIKLSEGASWGDPFETKKVCEYFLADCKTKICHNDVVIEYADREYVGCDNCEDDKELCKLKKIADNISMYLTSAKLAMESNKIEKAYKLIENGKAECSSRKDINSYKRECNDC